MLLFVCVFACLLVIVNLVQLVEVCWVFFSFIDATDSWQDSLHGIDDHLQLVSRHMLSGLW